MAGWGAATEVRLRVIFDDQRLGRALPVNPNERKHRAPSRFFSYGPIRDTHARAARGRKHALRWIPLQAIVDRSLETHTQPPCPLAERCFAAFEDVAYGLANVRVFKPARYIGDRRQAARRMRAG
jgi:hypothetical protein